MKTLIRKPKINHHLNDRRVEIFQRLKQNSAVNLADACVLLFGHKLNFPSEKRDVVKRWLEKNKKNKIIYETNDLVYKTLTKTIYRKKANRVYLVDLKTIKEMVDDKEWYIKHLN